MMRLLFCKVTEGNVMFTLGLIKGIGYFGVESTETDGEGMVGDGTIGMGNPEW